MMPDDDNLKVHIGDDLLMCENAEDAAILELVDGILANGSTEAYSLEELEKIVATLQRYDRRTGRLRIA